MYMYINWFSLKNVSYLNNCVMLGRARNVEHRNYLHVLAHCTLKMNMTQWLHHTVYSWKCLNSTYSYSNDDTHFFNYFFRSLVFCVVFCHDVLFSSDHFIDCTSFLRLLITPFLYLQMFLNRHANENEILCSKFIFQIWDAAKKV